MLNSFPTVRGLGRPTVFLVTLATVLSGCNKPQSGASGQLSPNQSFYVADFPIPAGFRVNEKNSRHRSYQGVRWVEHVYEGRQELQAVRNFYVTQMGHHEWKPTSDTLTEGGYVLKYKKGVEYCEVRITRAGWLGPTQVSVLIEPYQEAESAPRQIE